MVTDVVILSKNRRKAEIAEGVPACRLMYMPPENVLIGPDDVIFEDRPGGATPDNG